MMKSAVNLVRNIRGTEEGGREGGTCVYIQYSDSGYYSLLGEYIIVVCVHKASPTKLMHFPPPPPLNKSDIISKQACSTGC